MISRNSPRTWRLFSLSSLLILALVLVSCFSSGPSSGLDLKAEIYPAPLVGQEVTLHFEMLAHSRDLPNTTLRVDLPEGVALIDGETTWEGVLPADKVVSFDLTIKVQVVGKWVIHAYMGSDLGNAVYGDSVDLYITSTLNSAIVEDEADHPKATPPCYPDH